jgi:hypothetical protein
MLLKHLKGGDHSRDLEIDVKTILKNCGCDVDSTGISSDLL